MPVYMFHRLSRLAAFGLSLAVAVVAAGVFGITNQVSAASISYKGITLTPAIVNVDLEAGQTKAEFKLTVTNNTKLDQVLTLSSVDFKASNQSGGLAFEGNDVNQLANKHGLASWLVIDKEPIGLAPGKSKTVTVTVDNRDDLSPGGHYAAVLFKANTPDSAGGLNQVALNQVVSSLIFVRKIDGAQYNLKLLNTAVSTNFFKLPSTANITIKNTGNVQAIPRGIITINDPLSKEVSRGIVNIDSNQVLPDSTRLFQVSLFKTSRAWLPGKYTVTVQYRYDGSPTVKEAKTSYWYVNPILVISPIVAVVLGTYLLQNRRKLHRYVRR